LLNVSSLSYRGYRGILQKVSSIAGVAWTTKYGWNAQAVAIIQNAMVETAHAQIM
jgi:hypothetical protein